MNPNHHPHNESIYPMNQKFYEICLDVRINQIFEAYCSRENSNGRRILCGLTFKLRKSSCIPPDSSDCPSWNTVNSIWVVRVLGDSPRKGPIF